jgi:hypothetical protein
MFNEQVEAKNSIDSIKENLCQKDLSTCINEKLYETVYNNSDAEHKAKLVGFTSDYSYYWMKVVPDYKNNVYYNNSEMSVLLKFWLNQELFPLKKKCPLSTCNSDLDSKGVHALICKSSGGRISKHNNIVDFLEREAIKAAKNPRKEVLHILGKDNDYKPADLFIPNHTLGRDSCLDVGIANPMCQSYYIKSALFPLHAANTYSEKKSTKYSELCNKQSMNYFPICGECTGGWTTTSHEIFKFLFTASAKRYGIPEFVAKRNFYEKLSFYLQKSNAQMILKRDELLLK